MTILQFLKFKKNRQSQNTDSGEQILKRTNRSNLVIKVIYKTELFINSKIISIVKFQPTEGKEQTAEPEQHILSLY